MERIQFKIAEQQDLPCTVEIYNTTIASREVTADTEPVSVESRQAWFDAHNSIKRPLWIVQNEEETIVGWVSFQSFHKTRAERCLRGFRSVSVV